MKVIDLLNAIAGIGTIPYRIYYNGNVYEYDGETKNYYKSLNFTKDWLIGEDITALLNDEVEIIEEDKKIEYEQIEELTCNEYDFEKKTINSLIKNQRKLIDEINNLKENN